MIFLFFIYLSSREKADDSKEFSYENSKPCYESQIMTSKVKPCKNEIKKDTKVSVPSIVQEGILQSSNHGRVHTIITIFTMLNILSNYIYRESWFHYFFFLHYFHYFLKTKYKISDTSIFHCDPFCRSDKFKLLQFLLSFIFHMLFVFYVYVSKLLLSLEWKMANSFI